MDNLHLFGKGGFLKLAGEFILADTFNIRNLVYLRIRSHIIFV